jgi:DNA-binding transcriptional MerR regulator
LNSSYSIQDLCDQTGLPRRTIHFYTQQGLLPPPEGAGLGSRYGEIHLLRLQAIPRLRQQGLRLDQIRQEFSQLDPQSLRDLLLQAPPSTKPATTVDAQEFVHYQFGSGISLNAPVRLPSVERRKLEKLLQEALRIFQSEFLTSDKD